MVAMLVGQKPEVRQGSEAAKEEHQKDEKQKVTYHFSSQNIKRSAGNAWTTFVETQPEQGWKVATKKKAKKEEKPAEEEEDSEVRAPLRLRDTDWSVPIRTFGETGTATEGVCMASDEDGRRLYDCRKGVVGRLMVVTMNPIASAKEQSKPFPMISLTLENGTTTVPRYYTNIGCRLSSPKYTKEKGQSPSLGITNETMKLVFTSPKDHGCNY